MPALEERIVMSMPVLPPLAASIAANKTGDMAHLVSERGLPRVKETFTPVRAKTRNASENQEHRK